MKRVSFDFDFSGLPVRGRASKGIILSKNQVRKITKKEEGVSTLDAIGIWYDETVNRINSEERGEFIGQFKGEDRIIGYNRSGTYRTYGFDPTTHFEEDVFLVRKYDPEEVTTIIYVDGESRDHYIKRFVADDSDKLVRLISGHPESRLVSLSLHPQPTFLVHGTKRTKAADPVVEEVEAAEHIAVKGVTAKGKKLCGFDVLRVEEMGQQQQEQDHPDQSDEASQDQDQDHTDQSDEASQGPEQEQVHPDQSDEASQGPEQDQVNPDQSDEASQGPEQEQVNPDQASEASQGPEQQPQQEGQDEDQDTEAVTGARDRKKNKNETMPGKAGAKPKTGGQGTGESQMTLF